MPNENNTNSENSKTPSAEEFQKLKEQNERLEKHAKEILDEKKKIQSKNSEIIEGLKALGIDPNSENLIDSMKSLFSKKETETAEKAGLVDVLSKKLDETNSVLESIKKERESEKNQRIQSELSNEIILALDSVGINTKGKLLLENQIKSALSADDSGKFRMVEGDKVYSVADYAKLIAAQYPEFTEAKRTGGTGSFSGGTSPKDGLEAAIKSNNVNNLIGALVKRDFQK